MNAMQLCAEGIHVKPLLNHREDLLMKKKKKKKLEKIGENRDRDRSWTTASALLSDILFKSSRKLFQGLTFLRPPSSFCWFWTKVIPNEGLLVSFVFLQLTVSRMRQVMLNIQFQIALMFWRLLFSSPV